MLNYPKLSNKLQRAALAFTDKALVFLDQNERLLDADVVGGWAGTVIGLVLGAAGAYGLGRFLASIMPRMVSADPVALAGTALLLLAGLADSDAASRALGASGPAFPNNYALLMGMAAVDMATPAVSRSVCTRCRAARPGCLGRSDEMTETGRSATIR